MTVSSILLRTVFSASPRSIGPSWWREVILSKFSRPAGRWDRFPAPLGRISALPAGRVSSPEVPRADCRLRLGSDQQRWPFEPTPPRFKISFVGCSVGYRQLRSIAGRPFFSRPGVLIPADQPADFAGAEGLAQEIDGPQFHCFNGVIDCPVGRNHDHSSLGPKFPDPGQDSSRPSPAI